MAERTPPTVAVKQAWIVGHPFRATTTVEGREAEFDRWLAEVRREAAEKAWDEGLMAERTARAASEAFGFVIAPEPNPYTKTETSDE